jgi:hypothetical protein
MSNYCWNTSLDGGLDYDDNVIDGEAEKYVRDEDELEEDEQWDEDDEIKELRWERTITELTRAD